MDLSIYPKNFSNGIQAVLFDLDGVLIETEQETFRFYQEQLKQRYGILLGDEAFQYKIGRKSVDFWRDVLAPEDHARVDTVALTAYKRETFGKEPQKYIKEIPGGKKLLTDLRTAGYRTGLTTQNEQRLMQTVLTWLGLENLFDARLSLADIEKKKPDPEIYLKAAHLLKVKPAQCIVIEDSQDGVSAAKNAGMTCIAFAHPYTPAGSHGRADHVVTTLPDIIDFLTNKKMQTNR